ncbi:MAG TPA: hypothetical protein ACYCDB_01130 [Candidatus Azoamicus sp.]
MIIKYNPLILSIELLSHIILISINKNTYINYKEIIKEKNTEDVINLINEILTKNFIILKNLDIIILNYGIQNYTNSKIISAIIQSISLSIKIPTIKLSLSTALALNISKLTKKKYIIINKENESYINEEIYIKNINIHLLSNDIIYKKYNKSYINKNSKEINKNLNLYKQKKIIPHIYTYFFIKKKKLFNKFELPNKIIPTYTNKNFYSYYSG